MACAPEGSDAPGSAAQSADRTGPARLGPIQSVAGQDLLSARSHPLADVLFAPSVLERPRDPPPSLRAGAVANNKTGKLNSISFPVACLGDGPTGRGLGAVKL